MPAAYDTYDYSSYWKGRAYEHDSEFCALKGFLENLPDNLIVLEIGAGFGRLVPAYAHKAKKIILTDPSAKNLKLARKRLDDSAGIEFIQSSLENLNNKIKPNSVDLIVLVRVLHHIESPENAFLEVNKLLKKGGHLILEYANKKHFKANFKELLKGNIMYVADITPREIKGSKGKSGSLPFYNFHPDDINDGLEKANFKTLHKRSVSNIRSSRIKKLLPNFLLVGIEKFLQRTLASTDFGPSIFLLTQKV